MRVIHPLTDEPAEKAQCPYCHQAFYALPNRDPLRKHVDYCREEQEQEAQQIVPVGGDHPDIDDINE